nr:hypothetical protein [Natrinema hispanicum]
MIDRFEEESLGFSSSRATIRELLAVALPIVFTITIVSQVYWAMTGREDYTLNRRNTTAFTPWIRAVTQ